MKVEQTMQKKPHCQLTKKKQYNKYEHLPPNEAEGNIMEAYK